MNAKRTLLLALAGSSMQANGTMRANLTNRNRRMDMKPESAQEVPGWRHAVSCLLCTLLISCATSGEQSQPAAKPAPTTGHWSKVRANPPTYFPKGVAADHPTNYDDGYWVIAGDAKGTRYFIPCRGNLPAPQSTLIAEAMAARDPASLKAQAEKERNDRLATVAAMPLIVPFAAIMTPFVVLATPFLMAEDLERKNQEKR